MLLSKEEVKEYITEMIGEQPVYVCPYLFVEADLRTDGVKHENMYCGNGCPVDIIRNSYCKIVAFMPHCDRRCYRTGEKEF